MTSSTMEERNKVLDDLIGSRRTVRKFKSEIPPKELIEEILMAGLLAPYARLIVTREDYRRFIIIPRESEVTAQVASLIKRRGAALYEELENKMKTDEFLRGHGSPYLSVLKMTGQQGPPGIGKAPYYIVVAEQRGVPEIAGLSIAHCMENMWLKATALDLGFQILSITHSMAEDKEFCELIGIPFGEFDIDGCLIGYPDVPPSPSKRLPLNEVTKWL